jgi:hypothetical protein
LPSADGFASAVGLMTIPSWYGLDRRVAISGFGCVRVMSTVDGSPAVTDLIVPRYTASCPPALRM